MATVLASLAAARVAFPQTLVKPNLQGADLDGLTLEHVAVLARLSHKQQELSHV